MSQPLQQKNGYRQGIDSDKPEVGDRVKRWGSRQPKAGEKPSDPKATKDDDEATPIRDLIVLILIVLGAIAVVVGTMMTFSIGAGVLVGGALIIAIGVLIGVA
jgi:hypothetical protein